MNLKDLIFSKSGILLKNAKSLLTKQKAFEIAPYMGVVILVGSVINSYVNRLEFQERQVEALVISNKVVVDGMIELTSEVSRLAGLARNVELELAYKAGFIAGNVAPVASSAAYWYNVAALAVLAALLIYLNGKGVPPTPPGIDEGLTRFSSPEKDLLSELMDLFTTNEGLLRRPWVTQDTMEDLLTLTESNLGSSVEQVFSNYFETIIPFLEALEKQQSYLAVMLSCIVKQTALPVAGLPPSEPMVELAARVAFEALSSL